MAENIFCINSFNANGLRDRNKRKAILNWINTHHKGITFLQETHSIDNLEDAWKEDSQSKYVYFSHGTSVARGVCVILPSKADVQILNEISDTNGRFLLLHVIISNMELVLVNIYAPTKDKIIEQTAFISYVHDTLVNFVDKTIVIGGDVNIYMDPKRDKSGGISEVKSEP